ncbi:GvpL/GvpF family gas vesicle protein [Kitasatospora sp. A2-31]|uniref:GvpL/GvpF family gas vesicle protein n=1 Tax=Kitasatospora sp. A2-31 TaxID=2916414 RepID=UPI001EED21E2|nr:GvpL/GvpF family gas vesicle protein [Kitasatospora sp. A2-31]MCG6500133.1 GvpL/GvpF family gas vesicle protein [Kitasatospora sp. A2-31]
MAVYVYAIVAGSHPASLDGLTGVGDPPEKLDTLSEADLTAIISPVPEGLRARRRDVMAHQTVLQRLMADGTVLPLRFGMVASEPQEIREALTERADFYRERLHTLAGCAEYLLKAAFDEDLMLRQILQDSPEAQRLNEESRRSGDPDVKVRLGELVAGELRERGDSAAARVLEVLRPLARETKENEPHGNDFVSVSFLVEDARQEEFVTAESRLAEEWGESYQFRLHGPLPPYSFV